MTETDIPSGLTLKRKSTGFGEVLFVIFVIAVALGGVVASGGASCSWMGCSSALENFISATLLFFFLGGLLALAYFVMEDTSARYVCEACGNTRSTEEIRRDQDNPRARRCGTCFSPQ